MVSLKSAWLMALLAVPFSNADVRAQESGLPGGASELNERFGDWTVNCTETPDIQCLLRQVQTAENGKRLLEIAFTPAADGSATGAASLPLGLALRRGVTLQVDGAEASTPLHFTTCIATGCVLPLALDEKTLSAMREGENLHLGTEAAGGKGILFRVPLNGLADALDRAKALMP